jgi:hypothetical protein
MITIGTSLLHYRVVVRRVTGESLLCPVDGGTPRPLSFMAAADRSIRFSPDGTKVCVLQGHRVEAVDLANGRRETIRTRTPTPPRNTHRSCSRSRA